MLKVLILYLMCKCGRSFPCCCRVPTGQIDMPLNMIDMITIATIGILLNCSTLFVIQRNLYVIDDSSNKGLHLLLWFYFLQFSWFNVSHNFLAGSSVACWMWSIWFSGQYRTIVSLLSSLDSTVSSYTYTPSLCIITTFTPTLLN